MQYTSEVKKRTCAIKELKDLIANIQRPLHFLLLSSSNIYNFFVGLWERKTHINNTHVCNNDAAFITQIFLPTLMIILELYKYVFENYCVDFIGLQIFKNFNIFSWWSSMIKTQLLFHLCTEKPKIYYLLLYFPGAKKKMKSSIWEWATSESAFKSLWFPIGTLWISYLLS